MSTYNGFNSGQNEISKENVCWRKGGTTKKECNSDMRWVAVSEEDVGD